MKHKAFQKTTQQDTMCFAIQLAFIILYNDNWTCRQRKEKKSQQRKLKRTQKTITVRDSGSLVDSLKSATRIRVGSALAPAPIAERTFRPLRTQAARRATC